MFPQLEPLLRDLYLFFDLFASPFLSNAPLLPSDWISFSYTDDNKIKFINGGTFQKLDKLKKVYLQENICINEYFDDRVKIPAMSQILREKCGFDENTEMLIGKVLDGQKKQYEVFDSFVSKTILEKEILQSEVNALRKEIAKLNIELTKMRENQNLFPTKSLT